MKIKVGERSVRAALCSSLAVALAAPLVAAPGAGAAFGQLDRFGDFGSGNGEFALPTAVEVNRSNGQVLVADFDQNGIPNTFRIQRFAADGTFVNAFAQQTGDPSIDLFFQSFGGMAADGLRDVLYLTRPVDDGVDPSAPSFVEAYRLSTGDKLANFSGDANFNGSGALLKPSAVGVNAADGSVWIAGRDGANVLKVQRFAADGTPGTRFGLNGPQAGRFFGEIRAIDVAPNGDVWVADVDPTTQSQGRLQRFRPDGTYVTGFASSAAKPFFARTLGVDGTGSLYVDHAVPGVVSGGSVIGGGLLKLSPAGAELKRFGVQAAAPAAGACEFAGARLQLGVGNDADRLVYVADGGRPTNVVRRVSTFGDGGTGCGDFRELNIADATVVEGDAGTANLTFQVSLTGGPADGPVTVDYAATEGTASAPADFTAGAGTATIPAGQSSTTITVPVAGDDALEPDETVRVSLTNPSGADIDDAGAIGTITNDDEAPPAPPVVSIADVGVDEGDTGTTAATFAVSLDRPAPAGGTTVSFATANGTAAAPGDFEAKTGTVTVPQGQSTAEVTVDVKGDFALEPDETFSVALSAPQNGTIGDGSATGTIRNDDVAPPTASIGDVTVVEGDAGTTTATFAITLSAAARQAVTLSYATANGTAVAPGDFTAKSGTVTIPAGSSSAEVQVAVNGDTTFEPDEAFTVALSGPQNATIADGSGRATITNDDPAPPTPRPTRLEATPVIAKISALKVFLPNLTATLKSNGTPMAGRTVRFKTGSSSLCQATTNASGVATCGSLSIALSGILGLGYQATYAGEGPTEGAPNGYAPSTASASIIAF